MKSISTINIERNILILLYDICLLFGSVGVIIDLISYKTLLNISLTILHSFPMLCFVMFIPMYTQRWNISRRQHTVRHRFSLSQLADGRHREKVVENSNWVHPCLSDPKGKYLLFLFLNSALTHHRWLWGYYLCVHHFFGIDFFPCYIYLSKLRQS